MGVCTAVFIFPSIVCRMEMRACRPQTITFLGYNFLSIPSWSVGKMNLKTTWGGNPPLDKSRGFRPPLVSLITSAILCALLLYPSSNHSSPHMSYFPSYAYSSTGWTFDVQVCSALDHARPLDFDLPSTQAGSSSSSNIAGVWPRSNYGSFFPTDPFDHLLNGYVSDHVVGMFGSPVFTPPR